MVYKSKFHANFLLTISLSTDFSSIFHQDSNGLNYRHTSCLAGWVLHRKIPNSLWFLDLRV